MSQLADIEYIVSVHTDTDEAAALFLDLIDALHWDVDG
jgi:flavorubredoxin